MEPLEPEADGRAAQLPSGGDLRCAQSFQRMDHDVGSPNTAGPACARTHQPGQGFPFLFAHSAGTDGQG